MYVILASSLLSPSCQALEAYIGLFLLKPITLTPENFLTNLTRFESFHIQGTFSVINHNQGTFLHNTNTILPHKSIKLEKSFPIADKTLPLKSIKKLFSSIIHKLSPHLYCIVSSYTPKKQRGWE